MQSGAMLSSALLESMQAFNTRHAFGVPKAWHPRHSVITRIIHAIGD
jgi:hypothetical protein